MIGWIKRIFASEPDYILEEVKNYNSHKQCLYDYRESLAALAYDYYQDLDAEERTRLSTIFMQVAKRDFTGMTIADACYSLNYRELCDLQKRIEQDYKYTKH